MKINLPRADGTLAPYTLRGPGAFRPASAGARFSRIAYSAAHVVANARAAGDPWLDCAIDWDTTIAYRRRLWGMGLGVAEDAPYSWTLPEGAKGVQLVEAALQSWKERRWIDVPPLAI